MIPQMYTHTYGGVQTNLYACDSIFPQCVKQVVNQSINLRSLSLELSTNTSCKHLAFDLCGVT